LPRTRHPLGTDTQAEVRHSLCWSLLHPAEHRC
jgi:hypothetical protein